METTTIIMMALGAVALGLGVAIGALWQIRATLDRDRTLAQGGLTALQEELARVNANHAALLGGLRTSTQGLTATVEVLRRDVASAAQDARCARVEARKAPMPLSSSGGTPSSVATALGPAAPLAPPAAPPAAARATMRPLPPLVPPPRHAIRPPKPADDDGDETTFAELPPPSSRATIVEHTGPTSSTLVSRGQSPRSPTDPKA